MPFDKIVCIDSKDLSLLSNGCVALTVTSPPYHNAIDYSRHLGKKWYRGNLGKSLDLYLEEMETVFSEVFRVTQEGGYCCIVIGNEVVDGDVIPLPHLLTARLLKKWTLHEEIIWSKVTGGLDRFGVTYSTPTPHTIGRILCMSIYWYSERVNISTEETRGAGSFWTK